MSANKTVVKIEKEMFTPALQEAMKKSEQQGNSVPDSLMGATNAHLNMLVEIVGVEKAISMLQNQIQFLQTQIKK